MKNFVAQFSADDSGAAAIEYALLASLISVAIITATTTLGTKVARAVIASRTNLRVIAWREGFGASRRDWPVSMGLVSFNERSSEISPPLVLETIKR